MEGTAITPAAEAPLPNPTLDPEGLELGDALDAAITAAGGKPQAEATEPEFRWDNGYAEPQAPEALEENLDPTLEGLEETEETAQAADPAAPPAEPVTDPDLPAGVRLRKLDGKDIWAVDPETGKGMYASAQIKDQVEELLGGPVDPKSLERMVKGAVNYDDMITDFISGDPEAQDRVVRALLNQGRHALQAGEIDADPSEGFLESTLRVLNRANPEIVSRLESRFQSTLIDNLYARARETGDKNLLVSAQRVDAAMNNGRYRTTDEVMNPKPVYKTERELDIERREQELNNLRTKGRTDAWNGWVKDDNTNLASAKAEAIDAALANHKKAFEKFPGAINNMSARLREELAEKFEQDSAWHRENASLRRRAQYSTSPGLRAELAKQLKSRYQSRLSAIVRKIAPAVVSNETRFQAAQRTERTTRLANAQNRRPTPQGTPGPAHAPTGEQRNTGSRLLEPEDWDNMFNEAVRGGRS